MPDSVRVRQVFGPSLISEGTAPIDASSQCGKFEFADRRFTLSIQLGSLAIGQGDRALGSGSALWFQR